MRDENDLLPALPLEDRLRIAAVDLALTGAPRALVEAVWFAAETLARDPVPDYAIERPRVLSGLHHNFRTFSMRIIRLPFLVGVGLLIACAPAHVVTTPAPTPVAGTRIRYAVRSDSTKFVTGRLISLNADSLVFERPIPGVHEDRWVAGSVLSDSIARLQVRVGQRGNPLLGALFGALAGGAISIFGCASGSDMIFSTEQCVGATTVIGAGIGLLFGAARQSDVWAPTAVPKHRPAPAPVAETPVPGGIRPPLRLAGP